LQRVEVGSEEASQFYISAISAVILNLFRKVLGMDEDLLD